MGFLEGERSFFGKFVVSLDKLEALLRKFKVLLIKF